MPIVRMKPAMPGSVSVASKSAIAAEQQDRVQDEREDRVPAGAPVVDDHRDEDEQRADDRGGDALADRVEPERRADGPLLEVGQARRQRARAQHEREVVGLLGREAALDDCPGR